jgi:fucokinase
MTRDTEELQRIWHSTVHRWNRKRLSGRGRPFWDVLILTAANATQARGYGLELQRRREIGMIGPDTQVLIVPDRAGKRIGSGGATLWALRAYAAGVISGLRTGKGVRIADCGLRIADLSNDYSGSQSKIQNPKSQISNLKSEIRNPKLRNPQSAIRNPQSAIRNPEDLFRGKRVLMLHCGGEGRRVPSNAGTGKLFATLPFEVVPGRAASTFDALYAFLCVCAEEMDEGLVVVSGDVMAVFDPERLRWRRGGCCGIGIPVPLELAAHHGVYVPDPSGRRVMRYPQKPTPEEMRSRGWTFDDGRALVDGAGILKFSAELCGALARLAGVKKAGRGLRLGKGLIENPARRNEAIDLYTDLAWTLVPAMTEQEYLGNLPPGKAFVRRALWDALRGAPFWLDVMQTSIFIHLGNLRQILQAFETDAHPADTSGDAAAVFGSRDVLASYISPRLGLDPRAHVHNSFLDGPGGEIGPHCLVAECGLGGTVRLGPRVLLRGIETDASFTVESEVALFGIPLFAPRGKNPETAYCVHGVNDNPKQEAGDKGPVTGDRRPEAGNSSPTASSLQPQAFMFFLGMPLSDWMRKKGVSAADLWPEDCPAEERSLWNARLHPAGGERALELALWMQSPGGATGQAGAWRRFRRVSFADVFERIDYQAGFRRREALVFQSLAENLRIGLREKRDCRAILQSIGAAADFVALHRALREWIAAEKNPLAAARMMTFEANLLASREFADALGRRGIADCGFRIADSGKRISHSIRNPESAIRNPESAIRKTRDTGEYENDSRRRTLARSARDASLRKVSEAVASGVARTEALDLEAVRAERVVIASPARIDFGGGWTDTPPQCLERGGVILSAAVRLNGEYPIRVSCEKIEERAIRIESAEARGGHTLRAVADLPRYQRLDDPFGLVKAALGAIGLCNEGAPDLPPLENRLEQWGHGLRITTRGNVPKGSGLGTSSILGAAAIACLRRVFGAPLDTTTIFRQVLYLEQLLTSGGGWQDQLGALVPGIKLAQVPADPAFVLRPKVEPLDLSEEILGQINRRLVLFYVGKRRVAFNMLREIVVGYLSGNPDADHALRALSDLAFEMRESLLAGDLDCFGAQMTRTRLLYRLLCPATTSDLLETIFAAASPYVSGGKCAGAGGGGFVMLMARSEKDARLLRERLTDFSWRGLGEFYDFDVDLRGLHEAQKE